MSHVVITGATSGIGRALAIRLAAPAVTLSLLGRNRERLDAVAADAMASGARVEVAQIDVRDAAALSDWLAVRDIAVPIDTAIACAGIGGGAVMASAERGEDAAMAVDVMAVNAGGVANIVAPLVSRFMARGRENRDHRLCRGRSACRIRRLTAPRRPLSAPTVTVLGGSCALAA